MHLMGPSTALIHTRAASSFELSNAGPKEKALLIYQEGLFVSKSRKSKIVYLNVISRIKYSPVIVRISG